MAADLPGLLLGKFGKFAAEAVLWLPYASLAALSFGLWSFSSDLYVALLDRWVSEALKMGFLGQILPSGAETAWCVDFMAGG